VMRKIQLTQLNATPLLTVCTLGQVTPLKTY